MDFSVIIPSSNRVEVNRAIGSVLDQVHLPKEIIVVVTGSREVLSPKYAENSLIKLIDLPSRNPCLARNHGAWLCNSDFVAFLDDDDFWSKEHLSIAAIGYNNSRYDVYCSGFNQLRDKEVTPEKLPVSQLAKKEFLIKNPGLRASNLIIRKTCFLNVQGFDIQLLSMNDLDIGIRLSSLGMNYLSSNERTVFFDNHKGKRLSTPGSYSKEQGLSFFYKKHELLFSDSEKEQFRKRAIEFWKVRFPLSQGDVNFESAVIKRFQISYPVHSKSEILKLEKGKDHSSIKLLLSSDYLLSYLLKPLVLWDFSVELFIIQSYKPQQMANTIKQLCELELTFLKVYTECEFPNVHGNYGNKIALHFRN